MHHLTFTFKEERWRKERQLVESPFVVPINMYLIGAACSISLHRVSFTFYLSSILHR